MAANALKYEWNDSLCAPCRIGLLWKSTESSKKGSFRPYLNHFSLPRGVQDSKTNVALLVMWMRPSVPAPNLFLQLSTLWKKFCSTLISNSYVRWGCTGNSVKRLASLFCLLDVRIHNLPVSCLRLLPAVSSLGCLTSITTMLLQGFMFDSGKNSY